jgi:hypothetical protein
VILIIMLRRLPGSPAGGAATVSDELPMLVHNKGSERVPSNITAKKLKSMHGSVANFIGTGKYHGIPPPAALDLTSRNPEGLEYDVDIPVNIYSKMWSACSEEARAELKKDVVRAYEIYGPDLQAVRGKSAKRKVIFDCND